jgi:hypothetical protein
MIMRIVNYESEDPSWHCSDIRMERLQEEKPLAVRTLDCDRDLDRVPQ